MSPAQEGVPVREVVVSDGDATGPSLRRILHKAVADGARVLIAEPGRDGMRRRPLRLDDLHRRPSHRGESARLQALVEGRTVLVTGAGGSIGSELCRQVARHAPRSLVMLESSENALFEIDLELRSGATPPLQAIVGDARDPERVRRIFTRFGPAVVLHAAAHKHVPLMEGNVAEAILNNIEGTRVILDASVEAGAEHVVFVSTDKAVRPTSVMGATKRVAELLVRSTAQRSGRHLVAVRFGNVLDSRGSVVPIFREQIARGGPVTVTDPEMRRYFMSIPEAAELVLYAGALGRGGEIFLLDMGEPIRIVDLATDMIALAGLVAGRDIAITFTGARPGERLFEELYFDDEHMERTEHPAILRARAPEVVEDVEPRVGALIALARRSPEDVPALVAALAALVPDYRPAERLGSDTISPPR